VPGHAEQRDRVGERADPVGAALDLLVHPLGGGGRLFLARAGRCPLLESKTLTK
jgi:hypothetical protein